MNLMKLIISNFLFIIFVLYPIASKSENSLSLSYGLNSYSQKGSVDLAQCEEDSLGDLWIFTLDKTHSMLCEKNEKGTIKYWTPTQIKDDVISKLSREKGILDQINYTRDRITIFELGYGDIISEKDSSSVEFISSVPIDSTSIHLFHREMKYISNQKEGLMKVLGDRLETNNYDYSVTFPFQDRVLGLHRMVDSICLKKLRYIYRNIHLVTIMHEDDVEESRETLTHTSIKNVSSQSKYPQPLNLTHANNSFIKNNIGFLDERELFTDTSTRNHIYMYDYVSHKSILCDDICQKDSIVILTPLNNYAFSLSLLKKQSANKEICCAYIDSVIFNCSTYPINQFLYNNLYLTPTFDNHPLFKEFTIYGKVYTRYKDDQNQLYYKSYPFVQYIKDNTALNYTKSGTIIVILLILIYFLWVVPNKKLLSISSTDGQNVFIRRGYSCQWDNITPLAFVNGDNVIFAKHSNIKRFANPTPKKRPFCIIIDSSVPLACTGNHFSDTTKNDIFSNSDNSPDDYPELLLQMYSKTYAGKIAKLRDSRFHWVRNVLYPALNRVFFYIKPHYYYWGSDLNCRFSSPRLPNRQFLLEYCEETENRTCDDLWLNTYYLSNCPIADVLICTDCAKDHIVWDVYQLRGQQFSEKCTRYVRHLIHYRQNNICKNELNNITQRLKKSIHQALRPKRIVCLDTINVEAMGVHFNVKEASCMAYVCLVENTSEKKCQLLYSPLTDADSTRKMILIDPCGVSRKIWTSLLPFVSNIKDKDITLDLACCESDDIVLPGTSGQRELFFANNSIIFDTISIINRKSK